MQNELVLEYFSCYPQSEPFKMSQNFLQVCFPLINETLIPFISQMLHTKQQAVIKKADIAQQPSQLSLGNAASILAFQIHSSLSFFHCSE